jgi:hypothetical protein
LKISAFVIALIASTIAYADPIYLKCSVSGESLEGGRMDIEVRLDESSGKVSHSTDKRIFNADGIWSADSIRYKYVDASGDPLVPIVTESITINRSTLKLTRLITIEYPKMLNKADDLIGPETGDCMIVETNQNKI